MGLRARVDEELGGEGRDVGEAPEVRAGVRRGPRRGDEDEAHVRGADVREHLEERARLALRRHRPERVQTTIVALYPNCDPTTSPKSTRRCVSSASSNEPSPPAAASERGTPDVSRPGQSMLWSYAPVSSSRVGARPAPRTEKTSRADDAAVARPRAREPAPAAT